MELVYLWVEDYKNIHEKGFNFSPKFNCHYDGETLTIKNNVDEDDNKKYIENFFGDNINVTAIVGKNGSGKSNILKSIIDDSTSDIDDMRFLLYYDGSSFFVQLKDMSNEDYDFNIINKVSKRKISIKDIKVDNNAFDEFYNKTHRLFIDNISSKKSYIIEESHKQAICEFQGKDKESYNIQLIIHLLQNKKIKIPFVTPEKINISLSEMNEDFNKEVKNYMLLNHFAVTDAIRIINDSENILQKIEVYLLFFYSLGYAEYDKPSEPKSIRELVNKGGNPFALIQQMKNIDNIINLVSIGVPEDSKKIINMILKELKNEKFILEGLVTKKFNVDINFVSNTFIKNYRKIAFKADILSFDFEPYPSNGEYNFLLTFARIFHCLEDLENKNILLVIDEGDLTLHPQWQKNYINLLISFLKNNFKHLNFHIILTTHSPFLLSDISKKNIIFLDTYKKDEDDNQKEGNCKVVDGTNQTFGANIHTLLTDSFFMEGGLMGEFAKQKINEIIKNLKDKEYTYTKKEKTNVLLTIESIGEPFLKSKLLDMYNRRFIDDYKIREQKRIDEQIRVLQEKREQL